MRPTGPALLLLLAVAPLTSSSSCGSSWGSYILASSGAHDCTGCGESIGSYEACELASESGASHLEIAEWADHSESWNGPPGCHVQDATNFQWNANEEGDRLRRRRHGEARQCRCQPRLKHRSSNSAP